MNHGYSLQEGPGLPPYASRMSTVAFTSGIILQALLWQHLLDAAKSIFSHSHSHCLRKIRKSSPIITCPSQAPNPITCTGYKNLVPTSWQMHPTPDYRNQLTKASFLSLYILPVNSSFLYRCSYAKTLCQNVAHQKHSRII